MFTQAKPPTTEYETPTPWLAPCLEKTSATKLHSQAQRRPRAAALVSLRPRSLVHIELANYRGYADQLHTWRGLSVTDREILAEHITTTLANASELYFMLPLWNPRTDPISQLPDDHLSASAATWLRRADVIAKMPDAWWVIEIKPSAAYVALGQALTYQALMALSWPKLTPTRAVVLSDAHDPALSDLFHDREVTVFDLPDRLFSPLTRPT